jgi:hypothetical protein
MSPTSHGYGSLHTQGSIQGQPGTIIKKKRKLQQSTREWASKKEDAKPGRRVLESRKGT